MRKARYEIDMTRGPLFGKLISFSVPLMLTGILQLLYNAADMVVVGKYGSDTSLAAVGSTGSLINLIVNVLMGMSVGAGVVVANAIGAGNREKASRATHTSIFISVVFGIVVGIFGVFMARPLLEMMKSPEDVIELSSLYVKIYFAGLPVTMLYNFGASILRATGDTKRPLYFLIASGLVNVVLNVVFVKGFRMDVAGVAIATVISTAMSATLVTICLMKSNGPCRLQLKKLRIYGKELVDIAKIGLPAGLQGSVFSISNVIIQSSINSFGSITMAGSAAASSLEGFVYTSMNAIYQAALTFTGQNVGAKQYKRINTICAQSLIIVTTVGIIGGIGIYLLGEPLVGIYDDNPQVIAEGVKRLGIISATYFICGAMDMMVGMMRGMGKSLMPMIVTVVGVCGVRIVWIYTVFAYYHSLFWLYVSYPVSWIVTLFIHCVCYFAVRKKFPKENMPRDEEIRQTEEINA